MSKKYHMAAAIVLLLIIISSFTGVSYALWKESFVQTNENILISGCFEMEFIELTNSVSLNGAYPIDDSKGLTTKPYSFKINNNCSIYGNYQVVLDISSATTIDLSNIKIAVSGGTTINPTIINNLNLGEVNTAGYTQSYVIASDSLASADEAKEYNLRLWIDADTGNEAMSKKFEARLRIVSVAAVDPDAPILSVTSIPGPLAVNDKHPTAVNNSLTLEQIKSLISYTATSNGNDISDQVTLEGTVNFDNIGTYPVTLSVTANNKTVTQVVYIIVRDLSRPYIETLVGGSKVVGNNDGNLVNDLKIMDNYDGDITDQATITRVAGESVGTYEVTVSVCDSSNNCSVFTTDYTITN